MTESDLKRALVAALLQEGCYGRRLEDKYAVGTLDTLLMTENNVIYAEVKMLKGLAALPARVAQRREIERFNAVGNPRARALVIGYRELERELGFGLPGQRWDAHYTLIWPYSGQLSDRLDLAVNKIFATERA